METFKGLKLYQLSSAKSRGRHYKHHLTKLNSVA